MKLRLLLILAAAIGIITQPARTFAQQSAQATFDALKQGGFVIVIRHGRTNESPAFPRDEAPTNLENCSGQTMLTEPGQDQARAIGAAFRNAAIPVGKGEVRRESAQPAGKRIAILAFGTMVNE